MLNGVAIIRLLLGALADVFLLLRGHGLGKGVLGLFGKVRKAVPAYALRLVQLHGHLARAVRLLGIGKRLVVGLQLFHDDCIFVSRHNAVVHGGGEGFVKVLAKLPGLGHHHAVDAVRQQDGGLIFRVVLGFSRAAVQHFKVGCRLVKARLYAA